MHIKENEWNNEFHEDLFKLFILASNNYLALCEVNFNQVPTLHNFQWEDRAVCEDKREFKVINRGYCDLGKEYRTVLTLSHKTPLGPVVYTGDTIAIEVLK